MQVSHPEILKYFIGLNSHCRSAYPDIRGLKTGNLFTKFSILFAVPELANDVLVVSSISISKILIRFIVQVS